MKSLQREVEKLTQDQYRVIQYLHGMRRVRISGFAGSGKTLVAAEKAIRLSAAGLRTLILCHNPLLANHIQQLTSGSGVLVKDFNTWIREAIHLPDNDHSSRWNRYEEPDSRTLGIAFDSILSKGPFFDAVIVDEGQDFA